MISLHVCVVSRLKLSCTEHLRIFCTEAQYGRPLRPRELATGRCLSELLAGRFAAARDVPIVARLGRCILGRALKRCLVVCELPALPPLPRVTGASVLLIESGLSVRSSTLTYALAGGGGGGMKAGGSIRCVGSTSIVSPKSWRFFGGAPSGVLFAAVTAASSLSCVVAGCWERAGPLAARERLPRVEPLDDTEAASASRSGACT